MQGATDVCKHLSLDASPLSYEPSYSWRRMIKSDVKASPGEKFMYRLLIWTSQIAAMATEMYKKWLERCPHASTERIARLTKKKLSPVLTNSRRVTN